MVFHAPDDDGRAFEFFCDTAQECVHFIPNFRVVQEWFAVFCRENQVDMELYASLERR